MIERPPCLRETWGCDCGSVRQSCLLAVLLRAAWRSALAATSRLGGSHHLTGLISSVAPGNARRFPCDGQALLRRGLLLRFLLSIVHFLTSFSLGLPFFLSMGSTGSVESLTAKTRRVLLSSLRWVRKIHKTIFPCFYDYGFLVNLDVIVRVEELYVKRRVPIFPRSTLPLDCMIIEHHVYDSRVIKHQRKYLW